MKRLNMLNRVMNKNTNFVHPVSSYQFFRLYLSMINITIVDDKKLTPQELEVMAMILAGPQDKDFFTGVYAKIIRDKLGIKSPNYIKLRRRLEDKGYIKDGKHTFVGVQNYFAPGEAFEFVYPVIMIQDGK